MQVFLISKDFQETAKVLDDKRLVKQNLEARQILNTLIGKSEGWKNHPAVLAFKGYEKYLARYGLAINAECIARGFKGSNADFFNEIVLSKDYVDSEPAWLSNQSIFVSHRGRLKCKGELDALCYSIKKTLKIKSINAWLKERYGKSKNQLKFVDIGILLSFMEVNQIPKVTANHYDKFTESAELEYVWPNKLLEEKKAK